MKYLTQTEAQNLDKDLMGEEGGFTLQQLMELAGLACAQTVQNLYPAHTHNKVLVAAGSGNQGGDGLVAARHLALFGYKPTLFYPKPSKNEFNQQLETQLKHFNVPRITPEEFDKGVASNDVILDAIFGFSFKGEPRAPFDAPIETLKQTNKPIVSVDIPSAWDVEKGNIDNKSFTPAALISLTAPKLGVKQFTGVHYLGGRFVPPYIAEKYALHLPVYPGGDQVMQVDDALFQPARSRHKLEELLNKAEMPYLVDNDKTPEPKSKYQEFKFPLNDTTLYDPEPLVFPNSTLQSQSKSFNLAGLSVSGLQEEPAGGELDGSEAGTIFSDSMTNGSQESSPVASNGKLHDDFVEETPMKKTIDFNVGMPQRTDEPQELQQEQSLSAYHRPLSQRPPPLPITRSQSVPVEDEIMEVPTKNHASVPASPASEVGAMPAIPISMASPSKTSPLLSNIPISFKERLRNSMAQGSGQFKSSQRENPQDTPRANLTKSQPHSAPSTLPSTTPKVSPPRRRTYVDDYVDNVSEVDIETASSSSASLPQVSSSLENSPVKQPPAPTRPRWSFGGTRRSFSGGMRSTDVEKAKKEMAEEGKEKENAVDNTHVNETVNQNDTQSQSELKHYEEYTAPIKEEYQSTKPQSASPARSILRSPHRSALVSPHKSSLKKNSNGGSNGGSKSVSFIQGLGVEDDEDEGNSEDSEEFINHAHEALEKLNDSPEKSRDGNNSNSFERFLKATNRVSTSDSTELSAADLTRSRPNYSVMQTPQAPGFYPMTPANIPRNKQSTPVKGEQEEEDAPGSPEFDVTKLGNNFELSSGRAPGFYPMTPAYKASPMSSADSFDVVDVDDNESNGGGSSNDKLNVYLNRPATSPRKATHNPPDASLFVALSDIEEALRSTAADVERRKKERRPQSQNKLLDVFKTDKSSDGLAKKAHNRTTDALAAYNEYTKYDSRKADRSKVTQKPPKRSNAIVFLMLFTQLAVGYLILQHVYNTLFNSFLTNYFDPLNPDIYVSEYSREYPWENSTFEYHTILDRLSEYVYGRPWPPS
ncbi:hypothetical protein E3Q15_01386 [Wallemia mellicola]|nr:hypothetical protein E3Q15_01386 [Wallemia mellicola]TIC49222.1 hypothetical protein E3Q05_03881 [Wallemia mellicola]